MVSKGITAPPRINMIAGLQFISSNPMGNQPHHSHRSGRWRRRKNDPLPLTLKDYHRP
ncbi:hypothetical protein M569_12937 [Genlisea aurea]|uniref:Uncharacterized protein n=1 Tax=Genlisea aurea TaxID=192259 RepID=S8CBW2_9LAMI|nr:hypothetical protein M569_12937 [Genlisea aurea]